MNYDLKYLVSRPVKLPVDIAITIGESCGTTACKITYGEPIVSIDTTDTFVVSDIVDIIASFNKVSLTNDVTECLDKAMMSFLRTHTTGNTILVTGNPKKISLADKTYTTELIASSTTVKEHLYLKSKMLFDLKSKGIKLLNSIRDLDDSSTFGYYKYLVSVYAGKIIDHPTKLDTEPGKIRIDVFNEKNKKDIIKISFQKVNKKYIFMTIVINNIKKVTERYLFPIPEEYGYVTGYHEATQVIIRHIKENVAILMSQGIIDPLKYNHIPGEVYLRDNVAFIENELRRSNVDKFILCCK